MGPADGLTARVRAASEGVMAEAGRPVVYLADTSAGKEAYAREVARRDGVTEGPLCLLKAVEPCQRYEVRRESQVALSHRRSGGRRARCW